MSVYSRMIYKYRNTRMPTREKRARKLGIPIGQLPDGRGEGKKSKGSDHYRWNAGDIISKHGYVRVRVGTGHPLADRNGYAYEHHVVWREAGNPHPKKNQVIHHRNGDKTDNRLDNLEIMTRLEHAKEHMIMASDIDVYEIRTRYASGEDGTALAREYGIPPSRVYRFLRGETRKAAGGPIQAGSLRGNASRSRNPNE